MVKTTGIDVVDSLEPQARASYIKRARYWWQSLSPEQKLELLENLHKQAKDKIRASGGMLTHRQALLAFVNRDVKQQIEQTIKDMELHSHEWDQLADETGNEGYLDIARFLRDRRKAYEMWGLDGLDFDIQFTDNPEQIGVSIITKEIN